MMTMKRIEVPWTPACEREETALPRTGPAKRSSREAQGKPALRHKKACNTGHVCILSCGVQI